jgi:amino acid adenylation domain-containing protein
MEVSESKSSPLSSPQRQLWLLHQLDPGSSCYHNPLILRLKAAADAGLIRRALELIIDRHEGLRFRFSERDGIPNIIVARSIDIDIECQDISSHPHLLDEQILRAVRKKMDLEQGPLINTTIIKIDQKSNILILCFHHIIADGHSTQIVAREIQHICEALLSGVPPSLPAITYTYRKYIGDQNNRITEKYLARGLAHWRRHIGSASATINLPYKRRHEEKTDDVAKCLDYAISSILYEQMTSLRPKHGVTLFTIFSSAVAIALSQYTGQGSFLLGVPFLNRTLERSEDIIGHCVNVMPVRFDILRNQTVKQFMHQTQDRILDGLTYQDIPFEELVKAERPTRSAKHHPLFQSVVNRIDLGSLPRGSDILDIEPLLPPASAPRFDLAFTIFEMRGNKIIVRIEYDAGLLDGEQAEHIGEYIVSALRRIAANTEVLVGDIELKSSQEAERLLAWGRNDTCSDEERCVHEIVAQRAREHPDKVAVSAGDAKITYRELDRRANYLASHLVACGARPDSIIGVRMSRSVDCIVTLLAILKSGASYFAIEPTALVKRQSALLRSADVKIIVTDLALADGELPESVSHVIVATEFSGVKDDSPRVTVFPDNLAYVSFTSGSTGAPKGVMTPHKAVVRLVSPATYADLSAETVMLHFAPTAFDASTFEIWGALANGGRLVLAPAGQPDIAVLAHTINRGRVNTAWLTAGLFHAIVEVGGDTLSPIRQLIAGGDVLSPKRVREAFNQLAEGAKLINGYGPTEVTTFACCHLVNPQDPIDRTVPIGTPIGATQVYVIDGSGALARVGAAGELCIGGKGLSRGYLKNPAATAERFVPNPYEHGGRLYRTGDTVRWKVDGTLEFIGRSDNQIKIRGHRVEIAEIEAALSSLDGIRDCFIDVKALDEGEKEVVAYVVASDSSVTVDRIRAEIANILPNYMIPSHFIEVTEFPLTTNGKVDRSRLPQPKRERRFLMSSQVPIGEIEGLLARQFCEVLELDNVGRNDNFFSAGGHSLLAAKLIARIRSQFGGDMSLRTLFDHPTVAGMASVLSSDRKEIKDNNVDENALLIPIRRARNASAKKVFFLPGVLGHGAHYAKLVGVVRRDADLFTFRLPGTIPDEDPLEELSDMAAHCIRACGNADIDWGDAMLVGWSFGGILALEMAAQLENVNKGVSEVVLIDSYLPTSANMEIVPNGDQLREGFDRLMCEYALNEYGEEWVAGASRLGKRVEALFGMYCVNVRSLWKCVPRKVNTRVVEVFAEETEENPWMARGVSLPSDNHTVVVLPGNHYSLLSEMNLNALASIIDDDWEGKSMRANGQRR